MSGWEGYIYQIQHRYVKEKSEYGRLNICSHAAIYGNDGTAWAVSSDWHGLNEYQHPLEQEDGSTKDVFVSEFKCALEAAKGNRKPCEAGIRMGNEKFMFIRNDPATETTYLSKAGGGGATICKLKGGIVIGCWKKDEPMFNKGVASGVQNAGDCSIQVEDMAAFLKKEGY